MRIVHVLHSHGYGGAENHALLLMRGQRRAGHEVVFAGPHDSWLARACQGEGIPVHHLAMSGLYDPLSHLRLRLLVRRWRPDILHGHLIRGAYYAGRAAPRSGRPIAICTAHATTARKHMGRCRHIIAVSEAVRDNLIRHQYHPGRITTIYNGVPDVPHGDRTALRRELGIPDDAFAVANAGRFIPDKGQDLLIRALPDCPPYVHLYLIGAPDTPFGEQARALAGDQANQAGPRIHFLGYRPDVQRILPAFDAYALSSRREALPLPLALAEAFAARLPVVATTVGGVPEIVLDGQTGLHARPDDAASLAAGLTRLASQPAEATALAAAGRARFESQLTVERMVRETLSVYTRCLASHSP